MQYFLLNVPFNGELSFLGIASTSHGIGLEAQGDELPRHLLIQYCSGSPVAICSTSESSLDVLGLLSLSIKMLVGQSMRCYWFKTRLHLVLGNQLQADGSALSEGSGIGDCQRSPPISASLWFRVFCWFLLWTIFRRNFGHIFPVRLSCTLLQSQIWSCSSAQFCLLFSSPVWCTVNTAIYPSISHQNCLNTSLHLIHVQTLLSTPWKKFCLYMTGVSTDSLPTYRSSSSAWSACPTTGNAMKVFGQQCSSLLTLSRCASCGLCKMVPGSNRAGPDTVEQLYHLISYWIDLSMCTLFLWSASSFSGLSFWMAHHYILQSLQKSP